MSVDQGVDAGVGLAEPALLILVSLSSGPRHGYAITLDVESFASVRLGPGTLYAALTRLESRGLIAPLPPTDRRRPYRLTPRGQQVLATRLRELESLSRLGLGRMKRTT